MFSCKFYKLLKHNCLKKKKKKVVKCLPSTRSTSGRACYEDPFCEGIALKGKVNKSLNLLLEQQQAFQEEVLSQRYSMSALQTVKQVTKFLMST